MSNDPHKGAIFLLALVEICTLRLLLFEDILQYEQDALRESKTLDSM